MKNPLQHPQDEEFVKHSFCSLQVLHVQDEKKNDDLLEHINKVKALANQLVCLEVPMRKKDVVMTLLENLVPSYMALETMPMMKLSGIASKQTHDPSWRKDVKPCYYCSKPGRIVHFCYKAKNKNEKNANNIKTDDYAFGMHHGAYS